MGPERDASSGPRTASAAPVSGSSSTAAVLEGGAIRSATTCSNEDLLRRLEDIGLNFTAHAGDVQRVEEIFTRSESPDIRRMALWALGKLGRIDFVRGVLRSDADASVRSQAVLALQGMGGGPLVRQSLENALFSDGSDLVRSNAAYALADLGRSDGSVVATLACRLAAFGDPRERTVLIEALARTGRPEAIQHLVGVLDRETDASLRVAAASGLRWLPRETPGLAAEVHPRMDLERDPTVLRELHMALTGDVPVPAEGCCPPAERAADR